MRRPVHQPQRVGLEVPPRRRVVVVHPVLVEAAFGLEPLAGEAGGGGRSGGGVDAAEGVRGTREQSSGLVVGETPHWGLS
jgi:hypothetical protein